MSEKSSRAHIRNWIKTKLGYPTVMVELNGDQLDTCIDDALDELAPWIIQPQYITLPVAECIDLSEYNVSYVIRVHKGDKVSISNQMDVFNPASQMMVMRGGSGTSNFFMYDANYQLMNKTMGNLKDNISFKYINPNLYLDIGYPSSSTCTIEYSSTILDVEDINNQLYMKLLKQFSLKPSVC